MQRCLSGVLRRTSPGLRPMHSLPIKRTHWSINELLKEELEPSQKSQKLRYQRRFEDLPQVLLGDDGKPRAPLPPFNSVGGEAEPEERSPDDPELEAKWQHAVKARIFPDTPLAYGIFVNMQTYPDDIILTRVGMFYESYFSQAAEVASLLNIRLTSKNFKVYPDGKVPKKSKSTKSMLQAKFPFAGFPISQREKFFQMLLELGKSFVVVEEMDKAGTSAKDRFVARRYTPGTLLSEAWQSSEETRYLLSISLGKQAEGTEIDEIPIGLAYIDVSTDRAVQTRTSTIGELEHELARLSPVEVVLTRPLKQYLEDDRSGGKSTEAVGTDLRQMLAILMPLLRQSGASIAYIGTPARVAQVDYLYLEKSAEQLIETHLKDCLLSEMPKLSESNHQSAESFMQIDASTLLGLEIRQSLRQNVGAQVKGAHTSATSRAGTLLSVIRRTLTPSGTRLLVNTLSQPSTDLGMITKRHDLVEAFLRRSSLREDLRDQLKAMSNTGKGEISRILQRFSANGSTAPGLAGALAGGRDLWDLKQRIDAINNIAQTIKIALSVHGSRDGGSLGPLQAFVDDIRKVSDWISTIERSVVPSVLEATPVTLPEQSEEDTASADQAETTALDVKDPEDEKSALWWIDPNFSPVMRKLHDRLTTLLQEKHDMQTRFREKYNLPELELKMAVNNTPSLIHVLKKNRTDFKAILQDPEMAVLNDTAKTVRTFISNNWSVLANSIVRTREKVLDAQKEAFKLLREQTLEVQDDLLHNASLLDEVDLCLGFAQVADELRFVRPQMDNSDTFEIINGRHPTVEFGLLSGQSARNFTPNSLHLDANRHLAMITGPNMAGKSTLLRQMAIIAILAQAGSFVPADSARLGIVDAVFSRVGARDDLYMDRSTFMMEMHETAHILHKATPRSLVIMDEIGRGTTLNSGIAIAYAALDYILRNNKSKTLFATHYHELYDMLTTLDDKGKRTTRPGVEFWCTDVEEVDGRFAYSYRLKRGVNRQSHAIKTARQAGMPDEFIRLAESTLAQLDEIEQARTRLQDDLQTTT